MTSKDDPLQQLEEVEKAKKDIQDGKRAGIINRIGKSNQTFKNWCDRIKSLGDLEIFDE